ncbi:cytochrome c4 [Aliidiomarina taiwanensis]|uniref:Cytochrome c4 n=1 Tax=Aliidiomarina taiwanensis TaxID=946228 RepID=A0A432X8K2_9GAMM|nr:c-type cytochrome [Aliidiomarina taiwanensis]RUO43656.1 cytochrome c4 [Aliidiomarina taiwanensis]
MKKLVILFGLYMFAGSSMAADEAKQTLVGDAAAGEGKAAICAACHGPDGNSALGTFPSIAGQHPRYLVKQLREYKLGATTNGAEGRYDPVMSGQAVSLSEQDMYDLAAYFSQQEHKLGETTEEIAAEGMALFMGGDLERGITACAACHGPSGAGAGQAAFPLLSGQHPEYTKAQLEKFRAGERANDPNAMMRDVAAKLTDRDIEVLSQYIRGLH